MSVFAYVTHLPNKQKIPSLIPEGDTNPSGVLSPIWPKNLPNKTWRAACCGEWKVALLFVVCMQKYYCLSPPICSRHQEVRLKELRVFHVCDISWAFNVFLLSLTNNERGHLISAFFWFEVLCAGFLSLFKLAQNIFVSCSFIAGAPLENHNVSQSLCFIPSVSFSSDKFMFFPTVKSVSSFPVSDFFRWGAWGQSQPERPDWAGCWDALRPHPCTLHPH